MHRLSDYNLVAPQSG